MVTLPPPLPAEAVLDHVGPGRDVILPLGNGEPATLVDALEAGADRLTDVRVHQMHAVRDRPYLHGKVPGLRHISYFLSTHTRGGFEEGHVELVPNHFFEVPRLLRETVRNPIVLASVSPPDGDGYVSLGVTCDYVGAMIGRVPFFVEVNARMPRTRGSNRFPLAQAVGWCEADYPLVELPPPDPSPEDEAIARLVAERIPDGATLQAGIGSIPNAILRELRDHRDLGIHTELLSDGFVDLVRAGVATGVRKSSKAGVAVATFAFGSQAVYDFVHDNEGVELHPVNRVNDPRLVGQQAAMTSINATTEVDFLGQCASETIGGRYWSSSGGQVDFARGALYSQGGQGFIVLRSTARHGTISRIRPTLSPGSAVTTGKNTVDKVVTEYGVAELRGRSVRQRTRALIGIAHPRFRDELEAEARRLRYL